MWFWVAFFALVVVVPIHARVGFSRHLLTLWMITAAAAARLAVLFWRREPKYGALLFYSYVYLFFGIAGLAQTTRGAFPLGGAYDQAAIDFSAVLVLAGMGAFELAYRSLRQREMSPASARGLELVPRRVWMLAAAGVATSLGVIAATGGFGPLVRSRDAATRALFGQSYNGLYVAATAKATGALLQAVRNLPIVVGATGVMYALRSGATKRTIPRWVAAVCLLGLMFLVNNPIGNARLLAGSVALAALVVVQGGPSARWFRINAALILVLFVVVFPYADAFRRDRPATFVVIPLHQELTTKGDFDSFQQLMNTVRFTQAYGFQLGRQLAAVLLFWVPRSVWPGKPVHTGALVGALGGYANLNISAPLWAEGFVDGGIALMLAYLAGLGAVCGVLDRQVESRPAGWRSPAPAFVGLLTAYLVFVVRGPLVPSIPSLLIMLVLMRIVSSRSSRAPTSRP